MGKLPVNILLYFNRKFAGKLVVNHNYRVSGSQILIALFSLTVPNFVVFFRLLNEDIKNVLKTDIFLLQVGFTSDFVTYGPFNLCFCQFKF